MELKEYLAILRKKANLFLSVVLVFLLAGFVIKIFQPVRYHGEVVLNVTRIGQEETTDYRYDDFYRLQADELFADTVVRWLGTARMQEDIRSASGINKKKNGSISLSAKRLSSQMISVEILGESVDTVEKTAEVVSQIVNQESEGLNQWQKEKGWFMVVASDPVTNQIIWAWYRVVFISLFLGMFTAVWSVFVRHYFEKI